MDQELNSVKDDIKNTLLAVGFIIILLSSLVFLWQKIFTLFPVIDQEANDQNMGYDDFGGFDQPPADTCLGDQAANVARLKIYGDIHLEESYDDSGNLTSVSSEALVKTIGQIAESDYRAILVSIDSYGGQPVPSEEIMSALKASGKPIVSVVKTAAASGAYMIATAGDRIFANKFSDLGGIGVTYSYLDYALKNQREGATFNSLSSGKYKDILNPDKPLTPEERKLLERDINTTVALFTKLVAENRELDINEVKKLADGSTWMAEEALKLKLIDAIGSEAEAKAWLVEELGEEVSLCDFN